MNIEDRWVYGFHYGFKVRGLKLMLHSSIWRALLIFPALWAGALAGYWSIWLTVLGVPLYFFVAFYLEPPLKRFVNARSEVIEFPFDPPGKPWTEQLEKFWAAERKPGDEDEDSFGLW